MSKMRAQLMLFVPGSSHRAPGGIDQEVRELTPEQKVMVQDSFALVVPMKQRHCSTLDCSSSIQA